jgi:hypothetical protein
VGALKSVQPWFSSSSWKRFRGNVMTVSSRRWIIPGAVVAIALVLIGRWVMRNEDAAPVSPPPEAVISAPAQAQMVAAVETSSKVVPKREAAPEIAPPSPSAPTLRGRVYDEDTTAPIADASVTLLSFQTQDKPSEHRSATATDGTFVIEGFTPGYTILRVHAPGYATWKGQIWARDKSPPVEIGLSTGRSISGRLVAADGVTPVAGKVYLSNLDDYSGTGASTGPNGEFEFHDLAAGHYQLKGHGEGGMITREVALTRGQQVDGIVLALTAAHSIRGVITGLRPDEVVQVEATLGGMGALTARLDERGAFVISGVPPGRVHVGVISERRQIWKTVEMPADSDLTVNLDLPRGVRLSGRITKRGEPLPDLSVTPVLSDDVQPTVSIPETTTSSEGRYFIEDVPPGKYQLMAPPYWSGAFEVTGDTVFDFDVPEGEMSGRVLESGGEPIADATIYIWPAEPDGPQSPMPYRSDDRGRFTLLGLGHGELVLTVYKRGYELLRRRISYETPTLELEFKLREDRGVEIRARDANNQPPAQLIANEVVGAGNGVSLRVRLNEQGIGYIPSALAGTTLRFVAPGHQPAVIHSWNGDRLDLQLKRPTAP